MKSLKRYKTLFLSINIIIVLLFAISVIYASLFPYTFEDALEDFVDAGFFSWYRLIPFLVALFFLVFEAAFIWAFIQKEETLIKTVVIPAKNGDITISAPSLEAMTKMELSVFDELSDIRVNTNLKDNEVSLDIYTKVPPTVNVPEVSASIQAMIQEKIYNSLGIQLQNVRVFIDGISSIG